MFSHFTLGSNDLSRSRRFYTAVMQTLDQELVHSSDEYCFLMYGLSHGGQPQLSICAPFDELPATWSNGFHIAFHAQSATQVEQFHAAALANGGVDEGASGLRAHYNKDYFAAYVRDPDGNKLQAVTYLDGRRAGKGGDVVSHITLGMNDFTRDKSYYAATLGELGYVELPEEAGDDDAAFGIAGCELPVVYIQQPFDGRPATWGNGTHTAFTAPDRASVDRFHATALTQGGSCEGAPGLRPQYSDTYYSAYVRDHVGNKLQAVYRGD